MGSSNDFLKRLWANETFRICFIAAGIMICFGVFGIMQEKVMRGCFGGEMVGKVCSGEKYKYETTFVLILCTWYALFARFIMFLNDEFEFIHKREKDRTHWGWYAAAAFCYISAMVCGNMALRWISYPTQVIAKSSKPIPVMFIGVCLARKRYTIQKYIFVILIVVGVMLFVYKDKNEKSAASKVLTDAVNATVTTLSPITTTITTTIATTIKDAVTTLKPTTDDAHLGYLGLALVSMSLLADGVLGAVEDRMRAATKPAALNFMFSINMFSAIILFFGSVATFDIVDFYHFAMRYPDILYKIGLAALVGSLGQIFIFMMISDFGPLPCSIVTTTRKLFTVIISVLFMGNEITFRQILATVIVFGALFGDALIGKKHLCGPRIEGGAKPVPVEDPDLEKNGKSQLENGSAVEMEKLNKVKN